MRGLQEEQAKATTNTTAPGGLYHRHALPLCNPDLSGKHVGRTDRKQKPGGNRQYQKRFRLFPHYDLL